MSPVDVYHSLSVLTMLINRFKKMFFLILFLCSSFLFGQKEFHPEYADVLDRILKTLHLEKKDNLDSLNSVLKNSEDVCLQTFAVHYDASYDYLIKNKLEDAEKKSLECLRLAKLNQPKMHTSCYESSVRVSAIRLFYVYRRKGDFNKAIDIISQNKKFFQTYELQSFLATNHFDAGNYEKSIELFQKALKEFNSMPLDTLKSESKSVQYSRNASTHQSIADAYVQLYRNSEDESLLDSAATHYKISCNEGNKFNRNFAYNASLFYLNMGKIEYYKKNYKKAIQKYLMYFDHPVMQDNSFTYQSYCLSLAESYLQLKDLNSALRNLKKLDSAYAKNPGSEQFYIAGLSTYMEVYQLKGNDKKALQYAKLYLDKMRMLDANKINAIEAMNILNIDDSNQKAEQIIASKNQWLLGTLITGGVLVTLMFIIIGKQKFNSNKKQSQHQKVLEAMEEKILLKNDEIHEKPKIVYDEAMMVQLQKRFLEFEKNKDFLKPEFKLPYLAKKLGSNTTYLSAFFNERLGKSFNHYLQEKRMNYLIELLNNEPLYRKYTVQAISEHIGYKSPSAFSKMFKQHTGQSYSSFLENIKNKDLNDSQLS